MHSLCHRATTAEPTSDVLGSGSDSRTGANGRSAEIRDQGRIGQCAEMASQPLSRHALGSRWRECWRRPGCCLGRRAPTSLRLTNRDVRQAPVLRTYRERHLGPDRIGRIVGNPLVEPMLCDSGVATARQRDHVVGRSSCQSPSVAHHYRAAAAVVVWASLRIFLPAGPTALDLCALILLPLLLGPLDAAWRSCGYTCPESVQVGISAGNARTEQSWFSGAIFYGSCRRRSWRQARSRTAWIRACCRRGAGADVVRRALHRRALSSFVSGIAEFRRPGGSSASADQAGRRR